MRSSRNRFGLLCHQSVCLSVETRPTLLEERLCAFRLVQGGPEFRWIFGKLDLLQTT